MAKRRKRLSRKELQQTDAMTESLESLAKKLLEYRKPIIAGLVLLVGVLAAVGIIGHLRGKEESKRATLVSHAFSALWGKLPDPPPEDEAARPVQNTRREIQEVFEDEASRSKAVASRFAELAKAYGDEPVALIAAALEHRSPEGAPAPPPVEILEKIASRVPELAPLARDLQASLAWRAGDAQRARGLYDKLAGDEDLDLGIRAVARIHAGDLQSPAFVKTGANLDAAKKAYREVLAWVDTAVARPLYVQDARAAAAARLALLPGGAKEVLKPPSVEPVMPRKDKGKAKAKAKAKDGGEKK